MKSSTLFVVSSCLLFSLLLALPAGAATYIRGTDEQLADQASVIAEVKVLAVDRSPGAGRPVTDYAVEVVDLIDGYLAGSSMVVRVTGGLLDDGVGLHVPGAPRFVAGETALLFLEPRSDGTYGILHFMLGAFHVAKVDGDRLAYRDLSEATEVRLPGQHDLEPERPRNLELFRSWLRDHARGTKREADYWADAPAGGLPDVGEKYALPGGRWTQFDSGNDVSWQAHSSGQPGQPGGGFNEFRRGLNLWTNDACTPIRYLDGGTTTNTAGFTEPDGTNAIIFDDPNDEVEGSVDCESPSVLAVGGYWFGGATSSHNGMTFDKIEEGDIIINDGFECALPGNKLAEEVYAHELGHSLGLGHSSTSAALMWPFAHNDGFGARLGTDDRNGILFIYGDPPVPPSDLEADSQNDGISLTWRDNASCESKFEVERSSGGSFSKVRETSANDTSWLDTGPDDGGTYNYRVRAANVAGFSAYTNEDSAMAPGGGDPCECVADATTLCLDDDRFRVRADWRNYSDEVGPGTVVDFGSDDSGLLWFFFPSNWEMLIKVLDGCAFNDHFWVFAAATTDVEYNLEVTDCWTGATSRYSNELGNASPAINDTNAFGSACSAVPPSSAALRTPVVEPARDLPRPQAAAASVPGKEGTCMPSDTVLCLDGGRFKVEVDWRNYTDDVGPGQVVPAAPSADSGLLWFFSAANWEMLIKVLDGCAFNDHYWVFAAATTDVEYTLTVTDTTTMDVKVYDNDLGNAADAITDTLAFETCP